MLTNDATRCPYYQEESENVKGRGECQVPLILMMENINNNKFKIPNNEADCEVSTDLPAKELYTVIQYVQLSVQFYY